MCMCLYLVCILFVSLFYGSSLISQSPNFFSLSHTLSSSLQIDPVSKKKLWFLPNSFIRDISDSKGSVTILYQEFEKKVFFFFFFFFVPFNFLSSSFF